MDSWQEKPRGRFGRIAARPPRTAVRPVAVSTATSRIAERLLADNGGGMFSVPSARVRTTPESSLGSGRACDAGRVSANGLDAALIRKETERLSTL
ncbi:hypothetical protein [Streptomyces sp. NPDC048385]|uniref:hypothetical protein n=1 Tax=unclassified Streptomyces TaxID=2593676 RepID=UPI003435F119